MTEFGHYQLIGAIYSYAVILLPAVATTAIAVFTYFLFKLQKRQHEHDARVARANYGLAIHGKRLQFYDAIQTFLDDYSIHGAPSTEALRTMQLALRNAEFIFPESPLKFVDELSKKALEYNLYSGLINKAQPKYDAGKLSESEIAEFDKTEKKLRDTQKWIVDLFDGDRMRSEFGPYLKLPDSL